MGLLPVKDSTRGAVCDLILVRTRFVKLGGGVIYLIISPRIEEMPNEPRRRYFRNMAWFCFVLALSEALFAFLIFWAWLTIVWVAPVVPAIWLAVGAIVFFSSRLSLLPSRVLRGSGLRSDRNRFFVVDRSFVAYALERRTVGEAVGFPVSEQWEAGGFPYRNGGFIMSTAVADEKKTKLNQLEQLKKFTKVVADTADFESIKDFKPEDATTNPSLVYAATQKQQYGHLLDEVLTDRQKSGLTGQAQLEAISAHLLVQFGTDILEIVPGRVSTETDARLSYDFEGSINKGRQLIKLYEERKIPRDRVLIKIAPPCQALNPSQQLQNERILSNLTLTSPL